MPLEAASMAGLNTIASTRLRRLVCYATSDLKSRRRLNGIISGITMDTFGILSVLMPCSNFNNHHQCAVV